MTDKHLIWFYGFIAGVLFMLAMAFLTSCVPKRSFSEALRMQRYPCSSSGTEYIKTAQGLAPHLDRNGKPITCKP